MRIPQFILGATLGILIACSGSNESDLSAPLNGCTIQSPMLQTRAGLRIEFISPESGIPLNELFSIEVIITNIQSPEDFSILVDANMPAHGHGMLTRVEIEPLETIGHFRVNQLNLHMPGEWELTALLMDGETAEQVRSLVSCADG
jgi:hypothetical protein